MVKEGYEITEDIILSLINNPSMINKSPQDIITFLERLETDGFIDKKTMGLYILNILGRIYKYLGVDLPHVPKGLESQIPVYIKRALIPTYAYFINTFWDKFVMFNSDKSNFNKISINYIFMLNRSVIIILIVFGSSHIVVWKSFLYLRSITKT